MVVYVEYAFLQNFLLDGVLLSLAILLTKRKYVFYKVLLSSAVGGVFALLYPLLALPQFLLYLLKTSVGALLVLLAFGRIKSKKEWGRYALTAFLFFALTFAFGGALTSAAESFSLQKLPAHAVFIGFAFLSIGFLFVIRALRKSKKTQANLYTCALEYGGKRVRIIGFYDSGNLASKNGVPVCFVSPDVFYDLYGEEWLNGGQVCDEICFTTLAGEKKSRIAAAKLYVRRAGKWQTKEVYLSPSRHILSRDYKILLQSELFEEDT